LLGLWVSLFCRPDANSDASGCKTPRKERIQRSISKKSANKIANKQSRMLKNRQLKEIADASTIPERVALRTATLSRANPD